MPSGVASDLIRVLDLELRGDRQRVWVLAVVGVLLAGPAWVLAQLWGVVSHAGALAAGVGIGMLWAHLATRRYEASMRSTWKQWNRFAVACHSVPEIHRKVRGGTGRGLPVLYAAGLTAVWALEVLLLSLALADATAFWWSFVAVVANGLLVGAMAGRFLWGRRWTRALRTSIRDMVDHGEIGVWGIV